MRILHTADLHLGQILYQYYERTDEHNHFFDQLRQWCDIYKPDALVVSGDIFDIQQPSAAVKDFFNRSFVSLHLQFPDIQIVIAAGNHDSAARIEADREVWGMSGVKLVGHGPSVDAVTQPDGWQERFVVELPTGYIVVLPFVASLRSDTLQSLLDYVDRRNADGRPVVMMAHQAVSGSDTTGHSDVGNLRDLGIGDFGTGYDYLALGHIHRAQTIGHPLADENNEHSSYAAGIARYSGSALHVSCDEQYPHTVSLVDIDRHGGTVELTRLRIDELRHFFILPPNGTPAASSAEEVYDMVDGFCRKTGSGYIRLRIDRRTPIPVDFVQTIYRRLEETGNEVRFNPKTIFENDDEQPEESVRPVFEIAELKQMTDPLDFVRKMIDSFPELDINQLEEDFKEVENEIRKGQES